uniref:Uncharacterized protein n=1 Tax=Anopheles albimanus TaxID=7167 RepID=A0A182FXH4_ANOAL
MPDCAQPFKKANAKNRTYYRSTTTYIKRMGAEIATFEKRRNLIGGLSLMAMHP